MADLNLGRKRSSTNGSQDATLRGIKQAVEQFQFKGQKIDSTAVNQILQAIAQSQENAGQYQLDLASANNDTIVEKLKDVISKLYDAQTAAAAKGSTGISNEELSKAVAEAVKDAVKEELQKSEKALDDKLDEVSKTLQTYSGSAEGKSEAQEPTESTKPSAALDQTAFSGAFSTLQTYIQSQFESLNNNIQSVAAVSSKWINDTLVSPFKTLASHVQGLGTSLKEGFKNVLGTVGESMKNLALAPFKAVGNVLAAMNPLRLFGKKKKKKTDPTKVKLAKMIDKVNDFIDNFFDNMMGHVDKFLDRVLKSAKRIVSSLMTHIFVWLLANVVLLGVIFAILIKMIAKPLQELLQPIFDFLAPIRDFILNVLQDTWNIIKVPFEGLMKGIGTVAEALGVALGKLVIGIADLMVNVVMPFLEKIIPPLGDIIVTVFEVLKILLDALKPWIQPLVDVVLKALVTIMDILTRFFKEVGEILIDIAKIIHAPIRIVADFFEGFGDKAKEIGQKMGDIVLKVLTKIELALDNLIDIVRIYVVAPLKALQLKMRGALASLADYDGWGSSITSAIANAFGWGSLKKEEQDEARAANGKSLGELVNQQMAKMKENIAAEKEAQQAAELAAKLEKAKIDNLLANQHAIDDLVKYAEANNIELNRLLEHFNLESIEVELDDTKTEIDLTSIEDQNAEKDKEFTVFKSQLYGYLNDLTTRMTSNFDLVLEKLDKKPNLIPLPMMNPAEGNMTILENY